MKMFVFNSDLRKVLQITLAGWLRFLIFFPSILPLHSISGSEPPQQLSPVASASIAVAGSNAVSESNDRKMSFNLVVHPENVRLRYLSDRQQIVIQAVYADGSTQDVTARASLRVVDPRVVAVERSTLTPVATGDTEIEIQFDGVTTSLTTTIDAADVNERPLRFRNDVLPLLTHAGCNAGKCHGSASGKDGFRLSLYGFDPEGDFYRITREMSGRRLQLAAPDQSLLINKAVGEVPHTGGGPIELGSPAFLTLVNWIADGAQADPADTALPVGIEVFPQKAVLATPGETQQMLVLAKYDDGSVRDVTSLAVFFSNNEATATVGIEGNVTGTGPGSGFIMSRFDQFTAGMQIVVRSGKSYPEPTFEPANYIDELALARWRDLHVHPSELCTDEVFLRRAYLDLNGKLPTPEQAHSFAADTNSDKRQRLVEDLVNQPDFLDLWIMKLAELLQIRRANGLTEKGLSLYDQWLRETVHAGVPVDQLIRELIPASGSTFENPPTSYFQTETTPQLLAENIAQAFLGTRIQCAQCHNHPFDRWTMDDYYGFASFVSQVGYKQAKDPREITIYNVGEGNLVHPVAGREVRPKFLGGDYVEQAPEKDLRESLADWLASSENPAFSRNIANILWAQFLGIGIVDPVDDMRISNPPSNLELLNALAAKLVEYQFDVRRLAYDICTSKTYQLSTQANAWNDWDDRNFSHARIRRVRAEVLLDCISQVTLTSDTFSGLPLGGRAIQVPDSSSNSYFLQTFGRASRNTPCSCEVSTSPTLSQALHLLNGENTSGKILDGGLIQSQLSAGKTPMSIVDHIYLTCLTRSTTLQERAAIEEKLNQGSDVEAELVDLFWAVLNSNEFVFNH